MESKFWKEVVFLALLALFSTFFYFSTYNPGLYLAFIILSIVFYFITRGERVKGFVDYFRHASSHFIISGLLFIISYAIIDNSFVLVTLSLALVFFSVGFMEFLFERLEK